jgi:arylsulfatase A-like enzyme
MKAEGIDIGPALTGKSLSVERTLYWNTGDQLAVRRGDWKLIHNGPSLTKGTDELYNIAEDPYEKKDLAQEKFTLAGQMREILAREIALDKVGE